MNIAHTRFTDDNLCAILKATPSLLTLWINDCPLISDISVDAICQLKVLQELKIGTAEKGISADGLLKIVFQCKLLSNVDFGDGIVLDGNMFQQLVKMGQNIEVLDASESEISDDDLIKCYKHLRKMKLIILIDCQVTTHGKEMLQAKMPGLNIFIEPYF